jgi:putative tryptophan/tyrosine transport system substrate-binding protein
MRRRSFLTGVAALTMVHCARASAQSKMPLVGVMLATPVAGPFAAAFRQGLKDLGYADGKNIRLELRSAEGRPERFAQMAAELVRLKPDVIVAGGGAPGIQAARRATNTIPIVFPAGGDPVTEGYVQSLARPGGNITGLSILESEINIKRVQVLRELMPKVQRIALLIDPLGGVAAQQIGTVQRAASELGLELQVLTGTTPDAFEAGLQSVRRERAEALIVAASSTFSAHRKRLIDLVAREKIITVWEHREFPLSGGLLSYGPDIADLYRTAARYVDRILRGAKAGDLPVEQASKLELVINLPTAKALGLTIPGPLLVRADQVIQ